MDALINILKPVIVERFVASSHTLDKVNPITIGFSTIALVSVVFSLSFFAFSGYNYFLEQSQESYASLAVAFIFIGIAGLSGLVVKARNHKSDAAKMQARKEALQTIDMVQEVARHDLSELFENNPKTLVALAAAFGFISGKKL